MAKYLDSNGLSHFMGILKGLLHKHTVTITPSTSPITPRTPGTVVTAHYPMQAVLSGETLVITADSATTGSPCTAGTAVNVWTGVSSATTGSAHIIDNS